jgi:hypothetical protein
MDLSFNSTVCTLAPSPRSARNRLAPHDQTAEHRAPTEEPLRRITRWNQFTRSFQSRRMPRASRMPLPRRRLQAVGSWRSPCGDYRPRGCPFAFAPLQAPPRQDDSPVAAACDLKPHNHHRKPSDHRIASKGFDQLKDVSIVLPPSNSDDSVLLARSRGVSHQFMRRKSVTSWHTLYPCTRGCPFGQRGAPARCALFLRRQAKETPEPLSVGDVADDARRLLAH